jgi:hypothetical protein
MLRDMADRNYCPIVEVERDDAFRRAIPAVTLTRIGGNTALADDVRDQARSTDADGLRTDRAGSGLTTKEAADG